MNKKPKSVTGACTAKRTHEHKFTRSKPSATVETCTCGKFRFTEHSGPPIVASEANVTSAPRVGDRVSLHVRGCAECRFGRLIEISEPKGRLGYVWATVELEKPYNGLTSYRYREPLASVTKAYQKA